MRVRAKVQITESNFNENCLWVHAEPGDTEEVIHTDSDGYHTVRFSKSGTATVVSPREIETA
jgi:hypothetical protein